jgi:hypothetical protein
MHPLHVVTPETYRSYGRSATIACAELDRRRFEAKKLTELATLFYAAAELLEWAQRNGYAPAVELAAAVAYSTVAEGVQEHRE